MSDAVAENKAQETLWGSGNLISNSLEKQAERVVLAGDLVAALVLGATEGFQEPLLVPGPGSGHGGMSQDTVPVGALGLSHQRVTGWLGGCSEPFSVSSFHQLLGPCDYAKVT